ncbi:MAG: PD-(D/E)XK nuclease family protein [Bacteroidales bacterium]|jgi:hypothetical protein|nr:PD-(D/E)XK nuclease family protein [Bacteroidales bacterium]
MAEISKIIKNLQKSPMFNLSLSSKELFHSNFLYWLSLTYPDKIGAFIVEFCKLELDDKNCTNQKREEGNIDFQFSYKDGPTIYVENKVKSMPYSEQLERYDKETGNTENKRMILLSLTEPSFTLPKNWKHLSYQCYNDFLKKFETKDVYHKSLIEDYANFIDYLIIVEKTCIVYEEDTFDFHSSNNETLTLMKELRIHDLFLKKKYENIIALLKKKIGESSFCDITKPQNDKDMIRFESGMTRSIGLSGFKLRLKDDYFLLVQLQGDSYRMGVEYLPPKKQNTPNEFQNIVENFKETWLCFFENKKVRIKEEYDRWAIYPKNDENKIKLNQFGDSFYYRYINLGTKMLIKDLIDMMLEDIAQAIKLRDEYKN